MINFEEKLAAIHDGDIIKDADEHIIINQARQFELPPDFNTIIAYEGDVNSQKVTFECPKSYEGHSLFECNHKKLLWLNKSSGAEGASDLLYVTDKVNDKLILEWRVPSEAFTKSGIIDLSISLFDTDSNGRLQFAWNTPIFSQLQVASSMQEVGLTNVNTNRPSRRAPARDEILTIDLERRNIIAPAGYNYMIANVGEAGFATLHFQCPRYYKNLDLSYAIITISVACGKTTGLYDIERNKIFKIYDEDYVYSNINNGNGDGLLQFDWLLPSEITQGYAGEITIGLTFSWNSNKYILKISSFGGLKIGGNIQQADKPFEANTRYHLQGDMYNANTSLVDIGGIVSVRENDTQDISLKPTVCELTLEDGEAIVNSETHLYIANPEVPLQKAQKITLTLIPPKEPSFSSLRIYRTNWVTLNTNSFDWDNKPQIDNEASFVQIDLSSLQDKIDLTDFLREYLMEPIGLVIKSTTPVSGNLSLTIGDLKIHKEIKLKYNELAAEYKDNKYVGLKIGTTRADEQNIYGEQSFSDAPYVFSTELFNQTIENYLTDKNRRFTISAENYTGKETS